MKKIVLVVSVTLLALASCKKDYSCECKTTAGGVQIAKTTETITATESSAKELCDAGSKEYSINGVTAKTECIIK